MKQAEDSVNGKFTLIFYNYFNFLSIVLSLVMIILGGYFLILPKYKQILTSMEKQIEGYNEAFDKKEAYVYRLLDLESAYKNISQEDKEKINSILKTSNNPEDQFRQLERIVKSNGSIITSMKITPDAEVGKTPVKTSAKSKAKTAQTADVRKIPNGVGAVRIDITVEGVNYAGFKRLAQAIENSALFLDILNVSFEPSSMKAVFAMNTYYLIGE